MSNVIEIKGTVTALAPIHQTPDTSNLPKGAPTPSTTATVIPPERYADFFDEADNEEASVSKGRMSVRVPIFSANGLRGIMRRFGADSIITALYARGELFPTHLIDFLRAGAGRSRQSAIPLPTFDDVMKIYNRNEPKVYCDENNLLVSMFGAGVSYIPGDLMVSDLYPIVRETRHITNTTMPEEQLPSASEVLGFRFWSRKSGINNYEKQYVMPEKELAEHLASVDVWRESLKDESDEKSERQSAQHIGKIMVINPGTNLNLQIKMFNSSAAKLGLLHEIFRLFAESPVIGGKKGWGFGRVAVDAQVFESGERKGTIIINQAGEFHSEGFEDELAAYNSWIDALTVEKLDVYTHFEKLHAVKAVAAGEAKEKRTQKKKEKEEIKAAAEANLDK